MKRALALTLVLVLLGGIGLAAAAVTVGSQENQVTVTEQVFYGDSAEAEGLTVHQQVEYDNHIRWDITYQPGEAPAAETEFSFSPTMFHDEYEPYYQGMCIQCLPDYHQSYTSLESGKVQVNSAKDQYGARAEELVGINKAYHELYKETEAGEDGTKIIHLADYYDYYPLQFELDHPNHSTWWNWSLEFDYLASEEGAARDSRLAISEYFRIPVLEEETLELDIRKQADGQLWSTGYGSTDSDNYQMWTRSDYTDDAVYFTINNYTSDGKVMDLSMIPGGYGIYRLAVPSDPSQDAQHIPNKVPVQEVSTIFSLDPATVVTCLQVSEDQTRLYLLTIEDGQHMFTVLDLERCEVLQKMTLGPCSSESSYWDLQFSLYEKENVLILWLGYVDAVGDHFAVLIPQENGTFELDFLTERAYVFDYTEDHGSFFSFSPETFAWNGEQLAVIERLSNQVHDQQTFCSCAVAIYDASGLVYYSVLDNSLGITSFDTYDCDTNYNTPLRVEWDAE